MGWEYLLSADRQGWLYLTVLIEQHSRAMFG
jgi:hypothetical protein